MIRFPYDITSVMQYGKSVSHIYTIENVQKHWKLRSIILNEAKYQGKLKGIDVNYFSWDKAMTKVFFRFYFKSGFISGFYH